MMRYATVVAVLVLPLLALQCLTTPTAAPLPPVPVGPTLPGPTGDRPPTALLRAAGQQQVGQLGSYCWGGGAGRPVVCADAPGLIVPADVLTVTAGAQLMFDIAESQAPLPQSPNVLALKPSQGVDQARLSLASQYAYQLTAPPGHYVLGLFAVWPSGQGGTTADAAYGFNVVVTGS